MRKLPRRLMLDVKTRRVNKYSFRASLSFTAKNQNLYTPNRSVFCKLPYYYYYYFTLKKNTVISNG